MVGLWGLGGVFNMGTAGDGRGRQGTAGLEYVIPRDAWTSEEPPVLMGQELQLNAFDLWALHVWIWKENPSGIFASWNPDVSCANAGARG
jgi:hypothetical protein